MGRNVAKVYLSPAIPRDSRLWQLIQQKHRESGIPESQLLVLFASEYARMSGDGDVTVPTAVQSQPMQKSKLSVQSLSLPEQNNEDIDFDSFGDPD
jgi:hypothetical protein